MATKSVEIHLTYGYRGANCYIVIIKEREDGYFNILNDYGEVMLECVGSALSIGKFFIELSEGKYAY